MKVLIIRFSSIGDLTQALSIPGLINYCHPEAEIHFVTRQDLAELVQDHPAVARVWALDRKLGFSGLRELTQELAKENFTHIYDAHNNLRSWYIRTFVGAAFKLTRPMMRLKRFLLINFQINLFEKPFSGQRDLLKPLEKWGMAFTLPPTPQLFLRPAKIPLLPEREFVVLAPSATYELKRWPISYWDELVKKNPARTFVVLAGPDDNFTESLNSNSNVINLTGKTSLSESAAVIQKASFAVCNDTGLLHFAEQLGIPAIALMGPAPFGFPSRPTTKIMEIDLPCRPCSKHGQGPCTNPNFQQCLRDISATAVSDAMNERLPKL